MCAGINISIILALDEVVVPQILLFFLEKGLMGALNSPNLGDVDISEQDILHISKKC